MWKVCKIFLLAAIFLLTNFFTAEGAPTTKSQNTLRVGYVVNTEFMQEDRPGHSVGYGYEYMEILENYMACEFEYIVFDDWTDLLNSLNNGEVDIVPNLPGDHKWLVNARSTDHVVGRFPMELVIKPEQIKPHINLARVRTNYDTPGLDLVAREEGFTYTLVNYKTYQDILRAYENGEVDGYVDAMLFYKKTKPTYAVFDRQNYRLSVRADRTDLLNQLNWSMDRLLMDQSDIRDTLKRKYFLKEGFPLLLTRSEKNFLAEKKKLRTAVLFSEKPRIYRDDNGNLAGFIVEIINRIAEDLNVEIEIVETNSYEEARDLIQNGEIDFIADAICDYNWAEKFNMNPTQKYFQMDYVPVIRENYVLETSKNPKVACIPNMFYTMNFVEMQFPKENLVYLPTFEECLKAVSDGKADVVYINRDSVDACIDEAGTYNLEIGAVASYSQTIGLGPRLDGDLRLWHILNKEVNHIDASWVRDMINKHQQTSTPFSFKKFVYHNMLKVIILMAFVTSIIGGLIYKRSMNRKDFEMIQHMAYTDSRYNLPNIAWLEKEFPAALEKFKEKNSGEKLFFADFAMMSDALITEDTGYKTVFKQFQSLADGLKNSDEAILTSAGNDLGHMICFCKADSVKEISKWAAKIIENYSYMDVADAGAKIVIHMKAGISSYDENLKVRQMISRAATACRQVSSVKVKIFDDKMEETLKTEHELEKTMIDALQNEEFQAWYQPKYDLETRKVIGAEALVRWISPTLGFMPPGKFIPLFEQNGFIIQIDYYILEKACQLQMRRLATGKEVVPISVNQSRLHMTEEGYLNKMRAIVVKYKLPPNLIELEITETMFADFDKKATRENAERIITGLKELGFIISVDDFGAGYSSLSLLGSLPIDTMKIDRSVLTGADTSSKMKQILGKVIELGHSLGMNVICEGIETAEEENLLLNLGCRYGQGFFNAKPMPLNDFIQFFEKRNS